MPLRRNPLWDRRCPVHVGFMMLAILNLRRLRSDDCESVFVENYSSLRRPVRAFQRRHPVSRVARRVEEENAVVTEASDSHESFYDVLGVPKDVEMEALRLAYRKEARKSHPDLADGEEQKQLVQIRFEKVSEAYRTLSDAKAREAYDLGGLAGLAALFDNGERTIMPPPWRVKVGRTGHHFWQKKAYFVGFVMETIDIPLPLVLKAYEEGMKDPIGVGQAILMPTCTEKRANDIVDAFAEYGMVCLAEEVDEKDILEQYYGRY